MTSTNKTKKYPTKSQSQFSHLPISWQKLIYVWFLRMCLLLTFHRNGIIQYITIFWSLLSLSIMFIRPTHVSVFHLFFQFGSVAQSCPIFCNPMNRSTPGLPIHHPLPKITQTHAHRLSDAFQPSHPLLSPSPPTPNPSQHQGFFQ